MKLEEELELLEKFKVNPDWVYIKEQVKNMRLGAEKNLKSLEQIKEPIRNAYAAGYIKCLEDIENLPDLLARQKRTTYEMVKMYAEQSIKFARKKFDNVQSILADFYFGK